MSDCITTYTGRHIDPVNPDPDMICIEDIAHALSLICRGNGHVQTFFSVGQHCINCAREALARGCSDRMALACLLHDASECYLSDVPRPFKKTPGRLQKTGRISAEFNLREISGKFTDPGRKKTVKRIDDDMLWFDLTYLLNETQTTKKPLVHISIDYKVPPFEYTEKEYLELFHFLTQKAGR